MKKIFLVFAGAPVPVKSADIHAGARFIPV